jgi:hypothetical protein
VPLTAAFEAYWKGDGGAAAKKMKHCWMLPIEASAINGTRGP